MGRKNTIPVVKLVHVYTRLFSADVAEVKRLAMLDCVPWQAKLRGILHLAVNRPKKGLVE